MDAGQDGEPDAQQDKPFLRGWQIKHLDMQNSPTYWGLHLTSPQVNLSRNSRDKKVVEGAVKNLNFQVSKEIKRRTQSCVPK